MKARLIILVVAAVGMGVFLVVRPRSSEPADREELQSNMTAAEIAELTTLQTPLHKRDLPGEEPPEPADVRVTVEVDPAETKNRLYLYFSESHGYYVESPDVDIYHLTRDEDTGDIDRQYVMRNPFNIYIQANQVLRHCVDLVPTEMNRIGNDLGTSEDWEAEVTGYGRARATDPDPLPPLPDVAWCR
ncbi:MAG: hypothetical protein PVI86_18450 [Phycisphaerae bacterium]|jgi:hypothetical protein